jgi:hypothetical protein
MKGELFYTMNKGELIELVTQARVSKEQTSEDYCLGSFLKSKQPVSMLDRDKVKERFDKFLMRNNFHPYSKEMNCVRDFLIEEICNLAVSEGEVMTEGKIEFIKESNCSDNGYIITGVVLKNKKGETYLNNILSEEQAVELEGKNIQIIIRR